MEEEPQIESKNTNSSSKNEHEMEIEKEEIKENKDNNNNSIEKKNDNENIIITNGQDENYNLNYITKRSYSCRINEPKNKNFSGGDEIKLNLNKKFLYLKTPQIKPKKSKLNPVPLNIGSISCSTKRSRFNLLDEDNNNIMNDIISEGDNEESSELSSDSSSNFSGGEEIKENIEIENCGDNENNNINSEIIINKISTDNKKFNDISEFKIEEENDDYDENGHLSLKNVRRQMIQSKKLFLKNDKDIFNIIDKNFIENFKKLKDDILMGSEQIGPHLHNTTGFGQAHRKKALPILEFLRKNSLNSIKGKNK